jgi:hypothetical protein
MAFDWYDPKTKNNEDVKVSGTTITVTEAGLAKLSKIDPAFATAGFVALGWDVQKNLLGLVPASASSPGGFKFGLRGRSKTTRTISAARFFDAYRIPAVPGKETTAIQAIDGVAAIALTSVKSVPGSNAFVEDIPKRRGRKPKNPAE